MLSRSNESLRQHGQESNNKVAGRSRIRRKTTPIPEEISWKKNGESKIQE